MTAPNVTLDEQIKWAEELVSDSRMPRRFRDMHKAVLNTLQSVKAAEGRMRYLYEHAMLPLLKPHFTYDQWLAAIDSARNK